MIYLLHLVLLPVRKQLHSAGCPKRKAFLRPFALLKASGKHVSFVQIVLFLRASRGFKAVIAGGVCGHGIYIASGSSIDNLLFHQGSFYRLFDVGGILKRVDDSRGWSRWKVFF